MRGYLLELTAATTPEEIVLAALEGVAFSLANGVAALAGIRTMPARLGLIGGARLGSSFFAVAMPIAGPHSVRHGWR